MVVRIARLLLLLQLGAALLIAAAFMHGTMLSAGWALLAGLACVALFRLAITANNFFLAWRFRSATPKEFELDAWQALRMFLREYAATMTASSLTMPFMPFSLRKVGKGGTDGRDRLPVLLVHGYGCNSGYWHGMSKALTRAGITHLAVNLEPVGGSIDEYADIIDDGAALLSKTCSSEQVIIVAHSMGGLAARAYMRKHGTARLAKVITLGTPHHGTALAMFGLGLNTQEMLWKENEQEGLASEWLRHLAAREDTAARRLVVSLYSHHDNIIAPQTSSVLEGAANIAFGGIGHVALAGHPAIQSRVIQEISATQARASRTEN
ncbi:esterase/lipase family protein [Noviherbaspirillum galbum]|uniref:Alpha/beta fold hydrolase n=1 Tax=Noviherbaspirillum galbum TaxID=2709383 RepID=A0A6B3SLY5_9BURK|nr:alpha/beta fold hydrolase [Noviherbaspirillum galbum]NEX61820.1 alpha/beta fold hydrolase [Noviherbaspirillum galbum]